MGRFMIFGQSHVQLILFGALTSLIHGRSLDNNRSSVRSYEEYPAVPSEASSSASGYGRETEGLSRNNSYAPPTHNDASYGNDNAATLGGEGYPTDGALKVAGMPYNFEWKLKDLQNDYGHKESSDGQLVSGQYYVALPNGKLQVVTYHVTGDSGFVANVSYVDAATTGVYQAVTEEYAQNYAEEAKTGSDDNSKQYEQSYSKTEGTYEKGGYAEVSNSYGTKTNDYANKSDKVGGYENVESAGNSYNIAKTDPYQSSIQAKSYEAPTGAVVAVPAYSQEFSYSKIDDYFAPPTYHPVTTGVYQAVTEAYAQNYAEETKTKKNESEDYSKQYEGNYSKNGGKYEKDGQVEVSTNYRTKENGYVNKSDKVGSYENAGSYNKEKTDTYPPSIQAKSYKTPSGPAVTVPTYIQDTGKSSYPTNGDYSVPSTYQPATTEVYQPVAKVYAKSYTEETKTRKHQSEDYSKQYEGNYSKKEGTHEKEGYVEVFTDYVTNGYGNAGNSYNKTETEAYPFSLESQSYKTPTEAAVAIPTYSQDTGKSSYPINGDYYVPSTYQPATTEVYQPVAKVYAKSYTEETKTRKHQSEDYSKQYEGNYSTKEGTHEKEGYVEVSTDYVTNGYGNAGNSYNKTETEAYPFSLEAQSYKTPSEAAVAIPTYSQDTSKSSYNKNGDYSVPSIYQPSTTEVYQPITEAYGRKYAEKAETPKHKSEDYSRQYEVNYSKDEKKGYVAVSTDYVANENGYAKKSDNVGRYNNADNSYKKAGIEAYPSSIQAQSYKTPNEAAVASTTYSQDTSKASYPDSGDYSAPTTYQPKLYGESKEAEYTLNAAAPLYAKEAERPSYQSNGHYLETTPSHHHDDYSQSAKASYIPTSPAPVYTESARVGSYRANGDYSTPTPYQQIHREVKTETYSQTETASDYSQEVKPLAYQKSDDYLPEKGSPPSQGSYAKSGEVAEPLTTPSPAYTKEAAAPGNYKNTDKYVATPPLEVQSYRNSEETAYAPTTPASVYATNDAPKDYQSGKGHSEPGSSQPDYGRSEEAAFIPTTSPPVYTKQSAIPSYKESERNIAAAPNQRTVYRKSEESYTTTSSVPVHNKPDAKASYPANYGQPDEAVLILTSTQVYARDPATTEYKENDRYAAPATYQPPVYRKSEKLPYTQTTSVPVYDDADEQTSYQPNYGRSGKAVSATSKHKVNYHYMSPATYKPLVYKKFDELLYSPTTFTPVYDKVDVKASYKNSEDHSASVTYQPQAYGKSKDDNYSLTTIAPVHTKIAIPVSYHAEDDYSSASKYQHKTKAEKPAFVLTTTTQASAKDEASASYRKTEDYSMSDAYRPQYKEKSEAYAQTTQTLVYTNEDASANYRKADSYSPPTNYQSAVYAGSEENTYASTPTLPVYLMEAATVRYRKPDNYVEPASYDLLNKKIEEIKEEAYTEVGASLSYTKTADYSTSETNESQSKGKPQVYAQTTLTPVYINEAASANNPKSNSYSPPTHYQSPVYGTPKEKTYTTPTARPVYSEKAAAVSNQKPDSYAEPASSKLQVFEKSEVAYTSATTETVYKQEAVSEGYQKSEVKYEDPASYQSQSNGQYGDVAPIQTTPATAYIKEVTLAAYQITDESSYSKIQEPHNYGKPETKAYASAPLKVVYTPTGDAPVYNENKARDSYKKEENHSAQVQIFRYNEPGTNEYQIPTTDKALSNLYSQPITSKTEPKAQPDDTYATGKVAQHAAHDVYSVNQSPAFEVPKFTAMEFLMHLGHSPLFCPIAASLEQVAKNANDRAGRIQIHQEKAKSSVIGYPPAGTTSNSSSAYKDDLPSSEYSSEPAVSYPKQKVAELKPVNYHADHGSTVDRYPNTTPHSTSEVKEYRKYESAKANYESTESQAPYQDPIQNTPTSKHDELPSHPKYEEAVSLFDTEAARTESYKPKYPTSSIKNSYSSENNSYSTSTYETQKEEYTKNKPYEPQHDKTNSSPTYEVQDVSKISQNPYVGVYGKYSESETLVEAYQSPASPTYSPPSGSSSSTYTEEAELDYSRVPYQQSYRTLADSPANAKDPAQSSYFRESDHSLTYGPTSTPPSPSYSEEVQPPVPYSQSHRTPPESPVPARQSQPDYYGESDAEQTKDRYAPSSNPTTYGHASQESYPRKSEYADEAKPHEAVQKLHYVELAEGQHSEQEYIGLTETNYNSPNKSYKKFEDYVSTISYLPPQDEVRRQPEYTTKLYKEQTTEEYAETTKPAIYHRPMYHPPQDSYSESAKALKAQKQQASVDYSTKPQGYAQPSQMYDTTTKKLIMTPYQPDANATYDKPKAAAYEVTPARYVQDDIKSKQYNVPAPAGSRGSYKGSATLTDKSKELPQEKQLSHEKSVSRAPAATYNEDNYQYSQPQLAYSANVDPYQPSQQATKGPEQGYAPAKYAQTENLYAKAVLTYKQATKSDQSGETYEQNPPKYQQPSSDNRAYKESSYQQVSSTDTPKKAKYPSDEKQDSATYQQPNESENEKGYEQIKSNQQKNEYTNKQEYIAPKDQPTEHKKYKEESDRYLSNSDKKDNPAAYTNGGHHSPSSAYQQPQKATPFSNYESSKNTGHPSQNNSHAAAEYHPLQKVVNYDEPAYSPPTRQDFAPKAEDSKAAHILTTEKYQQSMYTGYSAPTRYQPTQDTEYSTTQRYQQDSAVGYGFRLPKYEPKEKIQQGYRPGSGDYRSPGKAQQEIQAYYVPSSAYQKTDYPTGGNPYTPSQGSDAQAFSPTQNPQYAAEPVSAYKQSDDAIYNPSSYESTSRAQYSVEDYAVTTEAYKHVEKTSYSQTASDSVPTIHQASEKKYYSEKPSTANYQPTTKADEYTTESHRLTTPKYQTAEEEHKPQTSGSLSLSSYAPPIYQTKKGANYPSDGSSAPNYQQLAVAYPSDQQPTRNYGPSEDAKEVYAEKVYHAVQDLTREPIYRAETEKLARPGLKIRMY